MTLQDFSELSEKEREEWRERVLALARQCDEFSRNLVLLFPTQFERIQQLSYGLGWNVLVTQSCELAAAQPFGVRWSQIKEKFGELRLYADLVDTGDPRDTTIYRLTFQDAIADLQDQSGRICQVCGAPGQRMRATGVMTLCTFCGGVLKATPVPLLPQELEQRGQR